MFVSLLEERKEKLRSLKEGKVEKNIYFFGDGKADGSKELRNLLGGKGCDLAEMIKIGIPVPPGFTISTAVCTHFYDNKFSYPTGIEEELKENLRLIEGIMKKKFGDENNPLLVSVRSGARVSMPGMM
ncbi:MAG: PEP/pyruvate-binding domain-containing protein, partial [bacterium]|nr:PEP/pyruvate-binding domain-containing protein [bacterium]